MKQHKLFWGSSYDRGLDILLYVWSDVLEKFPDAELHVCYGWELFDRVTKTNPERQEWKKKVQMLMQQNGVIHHGRVGKDELKKIRQECGIWAYPTYFTEIFCITAMDAQKDGLVPVTTDLAALEEVVQSGVKVSGDIRDKKVIEKFTKELIEMMGDVEKWKTESKKAKEVASEYSWDKIAKKWTTVFNEKNDEPLVTIYTPTVREGWWNIMANNIAKQTYKNLEWIIVDDHKDNRIKTAKHYADLYGINIRYMRGKERKTKRTYGLCNANNTAIYSAKGELLVFLQDFVLMPKDGIEQLVDVYRYNKDSFIAPVDHYYSPKKVNKDNKNDWFDGLADVRGKFLRKNIRCQGLGIRESDVVTDFEQNYGAVPTKILKDLGGYYEFYDEALGWDDTEIIYRAFKMGYRLIIDDSNIATCIDHWEALGKDEGGTSVNRTRRLNDPRYAWMVKMLESGKLPLKRTQEVDDKIDLQYEIPKNIKDEDCVSWIRKNTDGIVEKWM